MNVFRRLSATLISHFDETVRGMQNHDAVVAVSLGDLRRAVAEARVRHQRLRAECDAGAERQRALQAEAGTWRERARDAGDEATGLACLRRARSADNQLRALDDILGRQRAAEAKLAQAVERLELRHQQLAAQRHILRGREVAARTPAAAPRNDGDPEGLQETLERWEVDITEAELAGGQLPDALAEGFEAQAEQAELRAELAALRNHSREG